VPLRFSSPWRIRPGWVLLLLAAVAAALAVALPAWQGRGFEAARERGALRVGVPHLPEPVAAGGKVRTPERLDGELAQRLAQDLGVPARLVQVAAADAAQALADGTVDVVLAPGAAPAGLLAVDTGYRSAPRPVMRSDTTIRSWDDMRGRIVCTAQAAWAAQRQAARSGAQLRTYRVPSDALVAVRTGQCDAGLVDDTVWQPLMSMPEWKKFSATLPVQSSEPLHWLLARDAGRDAQWLARRMQAWQSEGVYRSIAEHWARNVAFDVYLDQEVPDCHG